VAPFPCSKEDNTARELQEYKRSQAARDAIAKRVPPDVCWLEFQRRYHSSDIIGQHVQSDSFLRAGTLPGSPGVDSDRTVASVCHRFRQPLHVTDVETPTRQQDDCFTFTLAEVLDVGIANFDDG
jgi:hypothetical protein